MSKKGIIFTVLFLVAFILFTVAVMTVDVQPIGPENSCVGFASLNGAVQRFLNFDRGLYNISEALGYACIATAFLFTLEGFVQLIKRKSFAKVDPRLYVLACVYLLALSLYLVFDRVEINYRPVIIDAAEGLKLSYPSSHTLMSFTFVTGAFLQIPYYINDKRLSRILRTLCLILASSVVITRMFSGVHWITDIVASVLLGMAVTSLHYLVLSYLDNKDKKI